MNSVSVCAEFLKEEKSKFYSLCNMLNEFYGIKLNNLKLITSDDKSKIIISCADTDISAGNLAGLLRDKYDIEPELQSINYVLLIASVGDTKNAFGKLALALKEIDKSVLPSVSKPFEKPVPICGCSAIVYPKKVKKTSFENCAGKISGEFI
ncbi:MAG: hypothetical protein LUG21_08045, partial [Clostridiales bacterium]|nr:hypothetical protein [Clostridiales bacterium]